VLTGRIRPRLKLAARFDAFIPPNREVNAMAADAPTPDGDRGEVVAALDAADGTESYVIADISDDEAWVSIRATDAPTLRAWR